MGLYSLGPVRLRQGVNESFGARVGVSIYDDDVVAH